MAEQEKSILDKLGVSKGYKINHMKTVTEADIVLISGVSGDFNPVHLCEEYANGLTVMGGSLTDVVFLDCDELHRMLWCKDFDGQQLTMSNVVLKKCKGLRQWSVEASSLVSLGPLSLQECGLQLCDLLGLTSDVYEDESGIDVRGCEFDYCLLGEDLIGLILEPERKNEVRP